MTSAITVCPGPKNNAYGHRVDLDASDLVDSYVRTISAVAGEEAWYAAGVYRGGHRSSEDWQEASAVTGDLDYYDASGERAAPPPDAREAIESALDDAPGTVAYHTPRGARVDAIFSAPISDVARWQRAADGLLYQLGTWLRRHRLDGDAAAKLAGYCVDPSARKPAQYMFGPFVTVAGVQRASRVIVITRAPMSVDLLIAAAPEPERPASRPAQRSNGAPESDLELAVQRYRTERTPSDGFGRPGSGQCPICAHRGCFGALATNPLRWACHSTGHLDGAGVHGEGCYHGDQLDIDAHAADRTRVEHLRSEGFLAPLRIVEAPRSRSIGPMSPEPPPLGRELGSDDGAPTPIGAPTADYVSGSRQTVEEIKRSNRANNELDRIAPLLSASIPDALEMFRRRARGEERALPLPWECLNELLGGGLWPGAHVLVGGTGEGKTQAALEISLVAAINEHPVLYVGLELDVAQILARLAALLIAHVSTERAPNWSDIYRGSVPAAVERAAEILPNIAKLPFRVEEAPPGGWAASSLLNRVAAIRERNPSATKAPVIIIDFLQLVGSEPDSRRQEAKEKIGSAAYMCREVARKHGACVLMLSSTSREGVKKIAEAGKAGDLGRVDASEFVGLGKESGDIEYSADTVMTLARQPREPEATGPSLIHVAVGKQRGGERGWTLLRFDGLRFTAAQQGDVDGIERNVDDIEGKAREKKERKARDIKKAIEELKPKILESLAKGPQSGRTLRAACVGAGKDLVDATIYDLFKSGTITNSGPSLGGHPAWTLCLGAAEENE